MNDRATKWQVRVIAVMVPLMWWAFLQSRRLEIEFPSLPENRRTLPPALRERPYGEDPHNPFIHARSSVPADFSDQRDLIPANRPEPANALTSKNRMFSRKGSFLEHSFTSIRGLLPPD